MPRVKLPIVGGEYDIGRGNNDEISINFYTQNNEGSGGKFPAILKSRPGLVNATYGGTAFDPDDWDYAYSPIYTDSYIYLLTGALVGQKLGLYRLTPNGPTTVNYTPLELQDGTTMSMGNAASVAAGLRPKLVNADTHLYIWDGLRQGSTCYLWSIVGSSLIEITDSDFPGNVSDIAFLDGYYIAAQTFTNNFYISSLNDGSSWDALEFASTSTQPDVLVGIAVHNGELWLFGETSTEIWYNSGDANFPFRKRQGINNNVGCVDRKTIVTIDNTLYWVGSNEGGGVSVYRAEGYTPKKVSTHRIDSHFKNYPSGVFLGACALAHEGSILYVLSYHDNHAGSDEKFSFVYNINTNSWSKWEYNSAVSPVVHSAYDFAFRAAAVVCDAGAELKLPTEDYARDTDGEINRTREIPYFTADDEKITVKSLVLECSYASDLEGDTISLTCTRNGIEGGTLSQTLPALNNDSVGRVTWRMLGQARDWKFKFTFNTSSGESNADSHFAIVGAYLEYEVDRD